MSGTSNEPATPPSRMAAKIARNTIIHRRIDARIVCRKHVYTTSHAQHSIVTILNTASIFPMAHAVPVVTYRHGQTIANIHDGGRRGMSRCPMFCRDPHFNFTIADVKVMELPNTSVRNIVSIWFIERNFVIAQPRKQNK